MKVSVSSALLIAGWVSAIAAANVPAVCYDICNSARLEGERMGWGNPRICEPGGPFMDYKQSCLACCYANGFTGTNFEGTQFAEVTRHC